MNKVLAFLAIASVSALGCTEQASNTADPAGAGARVVAEGAPPAAIDAHAHPSEGPHHGSLIELGNEEYHAELVHDDSSVTIYVLDSSATKAVPIEASDLSINLVRDGKPAQFKLAAAPEADDPAGKSSRFTSEDPALATDLDREDAAPKLIAMISGKSYRGEIAHDHDHEHGDDHGDEQGHAH